jgi:GNAT superfamily N-acetyltransferase
MTDITFQVERLTDILGEIQPLIEAHWQEIALYKDQFPLNPNYEKYRMLDAGGMIHTVTARKDGELAGYYISFVMPHLHYQDCLVALNDILFLKSDYRRGRVGMKMISFAEQELSKLGVHRMMIHVKTQHDFSPLLLGMGFVESEKTFEKLLIRRAE